MQEGEWGRKCDGSHGGRHLFLLPLVLLLGWRVSLQGGKYCINPHFVPQSDEWKCLRNKPKKGGNYTLITEKIEYEYSLDDQV